MISGIIHVLKSGGRWVDAPGFHGPHKTLYNRYVRWAAKGVWVDLFHALARAGGPSAQVYSSAVKAQSAQLRGSRCVPPGWRMTMRPHFTEASGIIGLIGLRWVASA